MLPDPAPPDLRALEEIVEGTAAETGEAFFDELVRHLARALGTKCALATEWLSRERRLRALSFWLVDRFVGDFEYPIAGTPCEAVIDERRFVHIPERLVELYRADESLRDLGAVSYLGVPLLDTGGELLGHIAVMHDHPLEADPRSIAIFRIFAGRAGAELRRLRRDRDLREREQKLSRLVASALDAIVELDEELRIAAVNPAGEALFGRGAAPLAGCPLTAILTPESVGRLVLLARQGTNDGRSSFWLPEGIEGVDATGGTFPAEATLSRFEIGGRARHTLILRSVNDRLEAESRIRTLIDESRTLRAELDALGGFDEIIGESDALRRALVDVERVAGEDTPVLVTGETGTGKELVARAIHRRSPRRDGPLVAVNCAAIATHLQESELFGHEKGAFTGATQRRDGRFHLAHGGTLFLDEIGDMPLDLQAKLLRVLQERELVRVGGTRTEKVDVRVIAATHRDLGAMVREGTFRSDLLYRIGVFPIRLPALRERGEDVVLLAEAFSRSLARKRGGEPALLTPADRARLRAYDWPGNVRELHNVIERARILARGGRTLDLERALPGGSGGPGAETREGNAREGAEREGEAILTAGEIADLERRNIERALARAGGKLAGAGGAAELLGIHPNTLASRLKTLGIRRPPKG